MIFCQTAARFHGMLYRSFSGLHSFICLFFFKLRLSQLYLLLLPLMWYDRKSYAFCSLCIMILIVLSNLTADLAEKGTQWAVQS